VAEVDLTVTAVEVLVNTLAAAIIMSTCIHSS
jgi:hypothetical protein